MNNENTYWRPAYEWYAVAAWGGAAAVCGWAMVAGGAPPGPLWYAIAFAALRMTQRLWGAAAVWRRRVSLRGKSVEVMHTADLVRRMRPNQVWMGRGFVWKREHMQRLYELEKRDANQLQVMPWLLGGPRPKKGNPHIHGVEPAEQDLYVPLEAMAGHMFVPATTGAIKTRLLALLAVQAIHRRPRESVLIIDPKGDSELRELIRAECARAGRTGDFAYFHPAAPAHSVRLDPLHNWTRTTQVASRIGALVPSESGNDPFSAFGWRVCYLVAEACAASSRERPTLTTIRRYVESGVDALLHTVIARELEKHGVDWRREIEPMVRALKKRRARGPGAGTPAETMALVAYYKQDCQQLSKPSALMDGLISMYDHNREHSQKMLASLIPVLAMLTAGDLEALLSPDRSDLEDPRPILDGAKIVESGMVMYMGLDSLSDSVIANAVASITLADLASHAGARYNEALTNPKINIFVDEANQAVNAPFIELLNKGRAAGVQACFFSQTVSDFVAALGSEALAHQVLGNANTVVVGRIKGKTTTEYASQTFGTSVLQTARTSQATQPQSDEVVGHSASYGYHTMESPSDLVPPEQLGRLPDLEYFATHTGGAVHKGRIPIVVGQPV